MKKLFDRQFLALALALIGVTLAAYWPVFQADFVNFDDRDYVTENAQVKAGLTWSGVKWAFTTDLMGSWHPLTWLSHMMDVQLFGLNPGAHHGVNLFLHIANGLLLLILLQRLTGELWPSAVAAGLFALHPLHVESVAWVAERKDVLSAFFGLLSLLAYASYAQPSLAPTSQLPTSNSSPLGFLRSPSYWLTGLFLALGLLSKPMLVTWPFLMLLLDWWPLRRIPQLSSIFHLPSSKRLLVEKIPFLLLVGGIAVLTLLTQRGSEAVISLQDLPLSARVTNALHSVFVYLLQFAWPTNLAAFYPLALPLGLGRLLVAAVVVAGLSGLAFAWRRSQPAFGFGWLWYLIALFPVCGLVQAGLQAHADRYTYLPTIGIGIALAWGLAKGLARPAAPRQFVTVALLVTAALLTWRTHEQAKLWQDSEKLFRHALAVTKNNFMAYQGLGEEMLQQGQLATAKTYFETALSLYPRLPSARNNLGVLLTGEGKYAEALAQFQQVLTERPDFHMAHFNRAEAYDRSGQYAAALAEYRAFVLHQPADQEARLRIVRCLSLLGQAPEALAAMQALQQEHPADPRLCAALAVQLQTAGQVTAAVACYSRGLESAPDSPELNNNLAWLLATHPDPKIRNGARAVPLAERASQLTGGRQPFLLGTLAAAYAEAGRFDDAVATAQRAIALATAEKQTQIAARNTELLELYRARKPFHEPAK